ncbi:unnamed protein product (macronuclear) [Paramecium tetraurelia]|uniref:Uncharacterized protein n=1 Tax=Paramecium tetraurelia TaxID=5888 RepID=A0DM31_PARTE|nr:uncharacterized protein GSPATT00018316001 [Paramecium tetraurelia]CAK84098.1 unnamed protein product [Paramecium tetraurelia]|eukprot:XP_001451495.1 hypothetical protein (macronuclear) [Paramecium tetraurelia strain d4-2]
MNFKPDLQGWQDYVQTPNTNQLKLLSDSLNNCQEQHKSNMNPFSNNWGKKCITQQSQSPKQRQLQKSPFAEYRKQFNIRRQASPLFREHQFNFSQDTKLEFHRNFNNSHQHKNQKQSLVFQNMQRSQRQQLRTKLMMISKDLNNSQIYHIIQLINK